jgi:putative nucleotidyltransferase with HDIG domain
VAGALVRLLVLLVPVAASAVAGVAVSRLLPRPSGAGELAWWGAVLGASIAVLVAVDVVARRFLPLAALLRLTLVFPDRAPSRLSVALRTRNLRSVRAWAKAAIDGAGDDDVAQRATAVLALAAALNAHDRRTRGHSERVRTLALLLADELGLPEDEAARIGWAALLHDIGKLTVPCDILNKPGKPDAREWAILRRHPADGARMAEPLAQWLGDSIDAIEDHHEKYDGTGYPRGLAGNEIGLAGRIVGVTDAFETMTAVRSYKKPMSAAAAREELSLCAGSHFDPDVVRAFLNISLGRLTWTVGLASWLAQLPFVGALPRAGAQVGRFAGGLPTGGLPTGGALAGVGVVTLGTVFTVGSPVLTDADGATGAGGGASGSGGTGSAFITDRGSATAGPGTVTGDSTAADPAAGDALLALPTLPPLPAPPGLSASVPPVGPPPELPVGPPPELPIGPPPGLPPAPPTVGDGDDDDSHDCPPGLLDKDWLWHPLGGPPGQVGRCDDDDG